MKLVLLLMLPYFLRGLVLSRMLTLSSIGIWLCPLKRLLLHNEISKDKNVFHVHTYNECTKYTAPINKHSSCNVFIRRVWITYKLNKLLSLLLLDKCEHDLNNFTQRGFVRFVTFRCQRQRNAFTF